MRNQRGFTLIELLLVIAILGVLSSLAVVTLRSVRKDALAARTETVMADIKSLLFEKFEWFENRQLPFNFTREFYNPSGEAGRPISDLVPNAAQRQHIFKRALMEWTRSEIPTHLEQLRQAVALPAIQVPPSPESQAPYIPTPPSMAIQPEDLPNYWPGTATRNWVDVFRVQMNRRPHAGFVLMSQQTAGHVDTLIDTNPLDNDFWIKENNHGWDGVVVPGVNNVLNPNQLATGIIESAEMLYAVLYNTRDAQGRRGTHFLRPEDLGDVDLDGAPEIIDGEGFPLIFSVTIQVIGQNGVAVDRDAMNPPLDPTRNGSIDFRDLLLDPRYPAEPQDYLFHIGSIGLGQYPAHLQHLKHADFSAFSL